MKKAILCLAVLFVFLFSSSQSFSGEIILKEKEKDTWEMQNKTGEKIGTLKRDQGVYRFFDNNQEFMGSILESKQLMPKGFRSRSTKITPELAQLYLDLLDAIKTIK
ncbi:exported hypothetical protein [uncultured Desulfobacterium sp.]|uniref:Uncharacterized protein n=1 Tax=uncultured Desulfobacterium sp. TaxID=201089 RepID=A0A445N3L3_9BACT|nr:exported hypothetical protein [uncultured Desulfobacterium sp.]